MKLLKSLASAAAILAAFFMPAAVQADTIGLHLASVHSNNHDELSGGGWNNTNPGIYYRHSSNVVVGTYYNSIRQQSFYVGYTYAVTDWLDVIAGVITGYERPGSKARPVMPLLLPSVHFKVYGPYSARLSAIPKLEKGGAGVLHLSVERTF